jgi:hypothetical protein
MLTVKQPVPGDRFAHPVGRDVVRQLLLLTARSDKLMKNPVIGALN